MITLELNDTVMENSVLTHLIADYIMLQLRHPERSYWPQVKPIQEQLKKTEFMPGPTEVFITLNTEERFNKYVKWVESQQNERIIEREERQLRKERAYYAAVKSGEMYRL